MRCIFSCFTFPRVCFLSRLFVLKQDMHSKSWFSSIHMCLYKIPQSLKYLSCLYKGFCHCFGTYHNQQVNLCVTDRFVHEWNSNSTKVKNSRYAKNFWFIQKNKLSKLPSFFGKISLISLIKQVKMRAINAYKKMRFLQTGLHSFWHHRLFLFSQILPHFW